MLEYTAWKPYPSQRHIPIWHIYGSTPPPGIHLLCLLASCILVELWNFGLTTLNSQAHSSSCKPTHVYMSRKIFSVISKFKIYWKLSRHFMHISMFSMDQARRMLKFAKNVSFIEQVYSLSETHRWRNSHPMISHVWCKMIKWLLVLQSTIKKGGLVLQ